MKISLKWLNDYVDVKDYFDKPEVLGDLLTRGGLEVEEMTNRAKDYQHVVVGHILEKDKHPNADKLSLCRVTTGAEVHQIVCGAQNHKAGDKVIVALPGAVLPGNFVIKKAQVRGVDSGGMLCSYKELGLAGESDGIAILPVDAQVGLSFAEFGGYDDVSFELKVTPNRADCLSHYGLAREVACLLGRELKNPFTAPKFSEKSTADEIELEVKALDLCPRYTGLYLSGVKVGASPEWLQQKLTSVGMASINNIVDITNFVMMELGQPLHAFDAKTIEGGKVIVDRAVAGEVFVTLDGQEKTLKGTELTIRDTKKALCLAGVYGGKNSGVTDSTTQIFLESAYFLPMSARKTSRTHGLETDSAYRFSRGVDPEGAMRALLRAAALMQDLAGAQVFAKAHDIYPNPVRKQPVDISIETVSARLGYQAQAPQFEAYMKGLGCKIESLSPGQYRVLPPSFRFDLEIDMDLVEEYARLHGYEHIPETLPVFAEHPALHDKTYALTQKLGSWLRADGYQQGWNFAFAGSKAEKQFIGNVAKVKASGLAISEKQIQILNPLNEEIDVMRSTLALGLYKNLLSNYHHGNQFGRIYETGRTFFVGDDGTYNENNRMALIGWGQLSGLWNKGDTPLIFELKASVENILRQLNIAAYTWVSVEKNQVPDFIHQGQFAQLLVEGKKVGFIGTLHPVLLNEDKVRVSVVISELDLDQLFKGQPRPYRVQSISKLPAVERDLALVMDRQLKIGDVLKEIRKAGGAILQQVDVFDIYEGDKLEAGKKSVAVRMILQDKNATLQDAQIAEVQAKVLSELKNKFAIAPR